jgi:hypothetical protein
MRLGGALVCAFLSAPLGAPAQTATQAPDASVGPVWVKLDVRKFEVVERDSGPVTYYQFIQAEGTTLLRARYRPPLETVTLGMELPDQVKARAKFLRWRWRVLAFPEGSDECVGGKSDSAAAVFATFKRGLKYYILKYAWSLGSPKGAVCNKKRNWFMVRDTIILESNGPTNTWIWEQIDPRAEFVRHFGGTLEDVPDFVGIGLLTDGDQSHSRAEADYADFSVAI